MKQAKEIAGLRFIWICLILCLTVAAGWLIFNGRLTDRFYLNVGFLNLNSALAKSDLAIVSEARRSFNQIRDETAEAQRSQRAIALAHVALGNAETSMNFWPRDEETLSEFLAWATRAEKNEDWERARNWYLLATQMDDQNADHWYRLALVTGNLGHLSEAGNYYHRALTAPNRAEIGRSTIMTRLGELARRRDAPAWTEVYQWFDEALRGNDFTTQRDLFLARMGRAGAADQLKQYPAALDDYRWVADRQPGNYWASVHSGRLVWLLEKDFAAAEAYLSSAISIDDTSKWAYRELAHVYMQSGLLEGAIELYQQVLTLDPNDSLAKEKLHALISSDGP